MFITIQLLRVILLLAIKKRPKTAENRTLVDWWWIYGVTWKFLPVANRRTAVRLISAVEPHCFCGSNPT